jgi:hypothetical protein
MGSFLPGVPEEHVKESLLVAGGNELASGKFHSAESSAALAVNVFGWFVERPEMLPIMPGMPSAEWPAQRVEVEYCARFPWRGGKHPWLDAFVETRGYLIGIESKRFEPFRDSKQVSFSPAYSRPVWGPGMEPFERARDALIEGEQRFRFEYLDAAQLVKHAFGLVTEGRRKRKQPALIYIFAEPEKLGGNRISSSAKLCHRDEIARFAGAVSGAAVRFDAISYGEWFATWSTAAPEVCTHRDALIERFRP